jgi:transposase
MHQVKVPSTPADTAAALAQLPACQRVLFETGRMAPMLYHGLSRLGLPVVCVDSRQAYQALKSLATHKSDRNDARGLAHLARTGFFKSVHMKSLPAHAVRSLIIARKKLVAQRVTLEKQIRGPWCSASGCPVRSAPPSSGRHFRRARASPGCLP